MEPEFLRKSGNEESTNRQKSGYIHARFSVPHFLLSCFPNGKFWFLNPGSDFGSIPYSDAVRPRVDGAGRMVGCRDARPRRAAAASPGAKCCRGFDESPNFVHAPAPNRFMDIRQRSIYTVGCSLKTGADRYRPDRSGQSWRVEAHVVLVNPRANQNCHQQRCCWSNRIRFGGFGSPRGLIRPHVARVHACVTRAANKQQARSSVTPWRGGIKLTRAGDGIGCHCRRPS